MEFNLTQLALVAFVVEALVQAIKPIYKDRVWNRNALMAMVVGVIVCMLTGADLFKSVGLPSALPFAGSVLTGIVASRGSNVINDIFKFVEGRARPTETGGVG